jgi:N-acetyl-gamma-glutamyl-phosphate reductase
MNKNAKIVVGVVGASGYVGGELLRYLSGHPEVEIAAMTGSSQQGQAVESLFPNLKGIVEGPLTEADYDALGRSCDLVFSSLPHGISQEPVAQLLKAGARVIDMGADFRLRDAAVYEKWYGLPHQQRDLLAEAVYGMPELHSEQIKTARLVANPGCYPTASLLALLPLKGKLTGTVIVDAKSGVSGAGRSANVGNLFTEVSENFRAYGVGTHRHTPEIEQVIEHKVVFTPHLVPMTRGILATVYASSSIEDLLPHYRNFYADHPFVKVLEDLPCTKAVAGTNFCHLTVRSSSEPGLSVIISAIDNLGKGAAGTAVHNLNLMFGLDPLTGLDRAAVYP